MALTQQEELLFKAYVAGMAGQQQLAQMQRKGITVLQVSMLALSVILLMVGTLLAYVQFTGGPVKAAAWTPYTENWTATDGLHMSYAPSGFAGGCVYCWMQGLPANGRNEMIALPFTLTITKWSVAGTVGP